MMNIYIALITLVVYSAISTIVYIISGENEDVIAAFGLGIFGLALWVVLTIIRKIMIKFKYHIGKRSIIEEECSGKRYKCKVKDATDVVMWANGYRMIKRYATKSEWINIPDLSKELINSYKKNCDHCKHNKECAHRDTVKCKHDGFGMILEFDKFEKK